MKATKSMLAAAGFGILTLTGVARADAVYTITNSYTAYSGYGVENIHDPDTNTLNDRFLTDYASLGGGTSTFIDMDFGVATKFASFLYADRTSSGGGNSSNAGGEYDDVTQFSLTFSNVADFSVGVTQGFSNNSSDPNSQIYPPGDVTSESLLFLTEAFRYVRFKVTAFEGFDPYNYGNVGGSELAFQAVPLPMAAWGGLGLLGVVAAYRLRRQQNVLA